MASFLALSRNLPLAQTMHDLLVDCGEHHQNFDSTIGIDFRYLIRLIQFCMICLENDLPFFKHGAELCTELDKIQLQLIPLTLYIPLPRFPFPINYHYIL